MVLSKHKEQYFRQHYVIVLLYSEVEWGVCHYHSFPHYLTSEGSITMLSVENVILEVNMNHCYDVILCKLFVLTKSPLFCMVLLE